MTLINMTFTYEGRTLVQARGLRDIKVRSREGKVGLQLDSEWFDLAQVSDVRCSVRKEDPQ